jgi:hypothetical protein
VYITDNKGFIVSYEINYDEPSYFCFFVSSKTLLKLALNVNHIHADATYKLIWQGYPVLVVGTIDKIRQFHPFELCICSHEQTADFVFLFEALKLGTAKEFNNQICPNTIVCDASPAIRNAFKQDCHIFYSPAKDKRDFTDNDMEINKEMKFNSFNEYKVAMFNIWTTTLSTDKEKWIDGKCDCPAYFKKRICKHVVGVAIRTKIAVPPPEAKAIPIGAKRRRGRPAKAKKAFF